MFVLGQRPAGKALRAEGSGEAAIDASPTRPLGGPTAAIRYAEELLPGEQARALWLLYFQGQGGTE
jgi:hypothetical protein